MLGLNKALESQFVKKIKKDIESLNPVAKYDIVTWVLSLSLSQTSTIFTQIPFNDRMKILKLISSLELSKRASSAEYMNRRRTVRYFDDSRYRPERYHEYKREKYFRDEGRRRERSLERRRLIVSVSGDENEYRRFSSSKDARSERTRETSRNGRLKESRRNVSASSSLPSLPSRNSNIPEADRDNKPHSVVASTKSPSEQTEKTNGRDKVPTTKVEVESSGRSEDSMVVEKGYLSEGEIPV